VPVGPGWAKKDQAPVRPDRQLKLIHELPAILTSSGHVAPNPATSLSPSEYQTLAHTANLKNGKQVDVLWCCTDWDKHCRIRYTQKLHRGLNLVSTMHRPQKIRKGRKEFGSFHHTFCSDTGNASHHRLCWHQMKTVSRNGRTS
jgi:hypothetical protein